MSEPDAVTGCCPGRPWMPGRPLSSANGLDIRSADGRIGTAYCCGEDGWEILDGSMAPGEVTGWRYADTGDTSEPPAGGWPTKVENVMVERLPGSSDMRRFEVTVRVTLPEIEGLTVAATVRLTETWACRAADEIELDVEPRDGKE